MAEKEEKKEIILEDELARREIDGYDILTRRNLFPVGYLSFGDSFVKSRGYLTTDASTTPVFQSHVLSANLAVYYRAVTKANFGATAALITYYYPSSNVFHEGQVLRVTASGTYSTANATDTVGIGIGYPSAYYDTGTSTAASVTNALWNLDWVGIIVAPLGTPTIETALRMNINGLNKDDGNTSALALQTTSLALLANWSAANASNSITVRQFVLEVLN